MRLFSGDDALIAQGTSALRIIVIAFPLVGASMVAIWLLDTLLFSRRTLKVARAS